MNVSEAEAERIYRLLRQYQQGTLKATRPSTSVGMLDQELTALFDALVGTEPHRRLIDEEAKREGVE